MRSTTIRTRTSGPLPDVFGAPAHRAHAAGGALRVAECGVRSEDDRLVPGNPQSAIRIPQSAYARRGNALMEFVLCIPFILFILAMLFHFGVGMVRKQRTIHAAGYGALVRLKGIGDNHERGGERQYIHLETGEIRGVGEQGPQYPEPYPWKGKLHPEEIQKIFYVRVPVSGVQPSDAGHGHDMDRLEELLEDEDDADNVEITQTTWPIWHEYTRYFPWEELQPDGTYERRDAYVTSYWHRHAGHGVHMRAQYSPPSHWLAGLRRPLHYGVSRENATWNYGQFNMWYILRQAEIPDQPNRYDRDREDDGLNELYLRMIKRLEERVGANAQTTQSFRRWFQH